MDTHAYGQSDTLTLGQAAIQGAHHLDNPQPGPDGALGVIFMGVGIAEIDKQTIAEQLSDMPIVALDNVATHPLILKRCTRSLSKPRSYEETMRCRFDPALEPMPAEATHLSPPCCVSTHRSRVVDPDGPTTFWITGRLSSVYHR